METELLPEDWRASQEQPENAAHRANVAPLTTSSFHRRSRSVIGSLARSFAFAFSGLWFLIRTQRNARIEIAIGAAACALATWLGISRVEWAIVISMVTIVLILEGINTAIEAAVDLASPERHPLAKAAKDVAAAMVLVAAMGSLAVGALIFGPPLWHRLFPN